jgi:LuxR family transcriptional regulator, maltose regulon positive regulatory protein
LAQGDRSRAEALLQEAQQVERTRHLRSRSSPVALLQARGQIEAGNLAAVEKWLAEQKLALSYPISYHLEPVYLLMARLYMAKAQHEPEAGHMSAALQLLARMAEQATATARTGTLVRTLILQALALATHGDAAAALQTLQHALTLAQPEQPIRIFVDEGPPMAALLVRLQQRWRAGAPAPADPALVEYVTTLLVALGHAPLPGTARLPAALPHPANGALVEPLSERELEVLRLLDAGLSSNEVAERLIIAVETARKHIKNIYGKLDAHSRLEAIRRGQELGLI